MDEAALAETIRGAQRGNAAALERLVDAFSHRIHGFLFRYTGSREDAEDLLQEVFVRVVRMIEAYQHKGRFEAWLFRIAGNLVRDRVRRVKQAPRFATLRGERDTAGVAEGGLRSLDQIEATTESADAALVRREETDALNAALARLPDAEREVIVLRHFSRMSFKEIAELTSVPLGTALARAHRGLARLRKLVADDATDGLPGLRGEIAAKR